MLLLMKFNTRFYKILLFFVSILIISAISMYFSILKTPLKVSDSRDSFIIYEGEGASNVAYRLDTIGVIDEPYIFRIASKMMFMDKTIKPGNYDLSKVNNIEELINYFSTGGEKKGAHKVITIPEGWTIRQIADRLEYHELIDRYKFDSLCIDVDFIKFLGFSEIDNLEGYLFPETYFFPIDKNEQQIIRMMTDEFKKNLNDKGLNLKASKFSLHELITLASIIQAEAGDENEMSKISSVFNNRLKEGWKLAADPTVKYIIADKNRTLYPRDFKIDNPYNTYIYRGLPPGPINNPGFLAIEAALNPDATQYFYFVLESIDSRKHIFSTNEKDHEKARLEYLKSKNKK